MADAERKLAKTFFFFALQGIRRRYARVETRFIAHTTQAWEFSEGDFFQVTGTGGTLASTAFRLALEIVHSDYDPSQYNGYIFYASDGENFSDDHTAAAASLRELAGTLNYMGYVETRPGALRSTETEMKALFAELELARAPAASHVVARQEDIWPAIRKFFVQQANELAATP